MARSKKQQPATEATPKPELKGSLFPSLLKKEAVLAAAIGAAATVAVGLIPLLVSRHESSPKSVLDGLFAKTDQIEVLDDDENDRRLAEWFARTNSKLRMVTIDGGTWLLTGNITGILKDKAKTLDAFELLLFNNYGPLGEFHDQRIVQQVLPPQAQELYRHNYSQYLSWYPQVAGTKSGFATYLYDEYPWARFTIFDDVAVSFVLVPTLREGVKGCPKLFSKDKAVVDCFIRVFEGMKGRAIPYRDADQLRTATEARKK